MRNLKQSYNKPQSCWIKSQQGWTWMITIIWMTIANFWHPFGLYGFVCMFTPIILAFTGWGKMSCARICPRGSFISLAAKHLSLGLTMPKWMHTKAFCFGLWSLMMGSFILLMFWAVPQGINVLGETILYFMEAATVLALIYGIIFAPRSWCTVCPMGTTSGNIRNLFTHELINRSSKRSFLDDTMAFNTPFAENSLCQQIIKGVEDIVWYWNLNDKTILFSSKWRNITGYESLSIDTSDENWISIIHQDDQCAAKDFLLQFKKNQTEPLTAEFRIKLKNGSYKWISCHSAAAYDTQGHLLRLTGTLKDISYQKKIEKQLRYLHDYIPETELYNYKFSNAKIEFFKENSNIKYTQRFNIKNELRSAVERNEFLLYYQPIVHRTGTLTGVEALIRWNHPQKGIVSPSDFIQIAESSRIIVAIGNWALNTACIQNKKWQDTGYPKVRTAVNISARQLQETGFVDTVKDALSNSGLEPEYLELEITESVLVDSMNKAAKTLERLRELGVKIALDDFGNGYSSLNYLKSLPIDKIKIDRSFIKDINKNSKIEAIISAMITLSEKMEEIVKRSEIFMEGNSYNYYQI